MIAKTENKITNNNIVLYLIGLIPLSLLLGTLIAEIVIFFIIIFFLYELFLNKNFNFLKNNFFLIFLLIYFYLIINLLNSSNFDLSLNRSIYFIRFPILVLAIAYFVKKNNYNYKIIYNFWTITISIVILDLYFQYIFGFNTFGFVTPGTGRLSGFLGDELKIAHLIIGFTMHIIIYNFVKNKKAKIFYLSIIFYLIILFLVNERSNAIRGIFIFFFAYLLINEIKLKEKLIFLIIIFSIVTSIISFNKNVNQRFFHEIKEHFEKNKISEIVKNTRYGSHYKSGLEIFKKNPYLGSGIKTFRKECTSVDLKKYYNDDQLHHFNCSTHPHQLHIEFLSELGIIGYILFIILFFFLLTKSFKVYLKNKNSNILCPVLFITAQYLPLIPSGSFFTNFGAIIFWTNVGLIYSEVLKYE